MPSPLTSRPPGRLDFVSCGRAPNARLALPLLAIAAAMLTACAPLPTQAPPARPMAPEALGLATATATATATAAEATPAVLARGDWWLAFKAPALDALVEQALAGHPSLALAEARLARARALIGGAEAADRPVVGAELALSRQRYTEHGLVPPPVAGNTYSSGNLQLGMLYEWDFFGRHRAALQAALGAERAAQADRAAARLSLSAALAQSYLELAGVQAQLALSARQLERAEAAQALWAQRHAAGLDDEQALRRARALPPELRRQALALQGRAEQLRHQLAALSAQSPDSLKELRPTLPDALELPHGALPGIDLLGRRPDLVAARWRVEAAGHEVQAARGQFYPNLSLGAFVGLNALGLDRLMDAGSRQIGIAPSLRLPLFDTGRLRAQLRGASADADAAVAAYNGALIEAVRDARDQLTLLQSLQDQARAQSELLAQLGAARELIAQRRAAGLSTALPLLDAEQTLLTQDRNRLALQTSTLQAQVGLLRSLGGGWSESPR